MPKIDVNKQVFKKLFGSKTDRNYLESVLPFAKAEYEDEDDENIRVELNDTNRPDLWSTAGLSRLLNSAVKGKRTEYDFFSTAKDKKDFGGRTFKIDKSRPAERPYSVGFCVSGKKIDENILKMLIDVQEKLHMNYGRKRKSISMGLYRSRDIKFPVIFSGAEPDKHKFVPLHETKEMTLREVLTKTEKGKEFGSIIENYKLFPFLTDSSGRVLSMPPIINSADVGALQVGDSDIFIEINGIYLRQVLLTANILACDFADLGFKILPVKVEFPEKTEFGSSFVVPYYFQGSVKCTQSEIRSILGEGISAEESVSCLNRMGVDAKVSGKGIEAFTPPYRNDFLSYCDVVEDIAIGYGIDNFQRETLHDFTVGRLTPAEMFSRKIQKIMLGLGYNEMIFNYLSSEEEYVDNMLTGKENVLYISNPMSQNFRVVRPSVIPSLLKAESVSQSAVYPHRMFETGKTAVIDKKAKDGTVTYNCLGVLESSKQANFNNAVSVMNTLMYYLSLEYTLKATEDVRFIQGRCAEIMHKGKSIGVIGEVNPAVLEKWQIQMPCFAFELNIDRILSLSAVK